MFDEKFKTILKIPYKDYVQLLLWLNENSKGTVDVKTYITGPVCPGIPTIGSIYIGFEDPDDALIFKIKYTG